VLDLKNAAGLGLQRRFRAVPGVIRAHRLGWQDQDLRAAGRFQQVDRLRLTLPQLLQAVSTPTSNVGATPWTSTAIRGGARVGLIRSIDDLCLYHGIAKAAATPFSSRTSLP